MTIFSTRLFRVLLFLALSLILVVATSKLDLPGTTGINDKAAHAATFLVLGILTHLAYPHAANRWLLYLLLLTYGLGIEVIQYFLPYRTFSLLDLAADAAGLALSYLLFLTIKSTGRARE